MFYAVVHMRTAMQNSLARYQQVKAGCFVKFYR